MESFICDIPRILKEDSKNIPQEKSPAQNLEDL